MIGTVVARWWDDGEMAEGGADSPEDVVGNETLDRPENVVAGEDRMVETGVIVLAASIRTDAPCAIFC